MKNEGMTKKRGKGREMKWTMLEVEEKLKDDGGVGEVQSQGMVEEKEGKKRGTRIEEIQEKGLFQAITHEETKAGCFLSMLPTGHRNLGKEKTLDRMRKGMTALLDLV